MGERTHMEQVGDYKIYSSEEVLDKHFGQVGTLRRDKFEKSVARAVKAHQQQSES